MRVPIPNKQVATHAGNNGEFARLRQRFDEYARKHGLKSTNQRDAIVDLFLKQGSGLGVLQTCQQRRPNQKVVVLSNYATPDIRKRCAQFGVDAVFDKSNEIDGLIDFCIAQAAQSPEASRRD